MSNNNLKEILNLDKPNAITIKVYLKKLLKQLWKKKESFSGKRPFGNTDWEYDLYVILIQHGIVEGTLDEDGWIEEFEKKEQNKADKIISNCIDEIFK